MSSLDRRREQQEIPHHPERVDSDVGGGIPNKWDAGEIKLLS